MVGVPGRTTGAEQGAFGGAGDAIFRRVGFANEDDARRAITLHQFAVVIVNNVGDKARTAGTRPSIDLGSEVLDEKGHAFERAFGQRALGGGARIVIALVDNGIEGGIVFLDTFDGGFSEFGGCHLALLHQRGEAETVIFCIIGKAHRYLP